MASRESPQTIDQTSSADLVKSPAAPEPAIEPEAEPREPGGWFARLRQGLSKSSRSLTTGITEIFTKRKLDSETLEQLEDMLIQADLGIETAMNFTAAVAKGRYDKEVTPQEVNAILAEEIAKVLQPVAIPFEFDDSQKPFVILVVGVNGAGKTTTIGKLAAIATREDFSVTIAAGDTFRAAAIGQRRTWAERIGVRHRARYQQRSGIEGLVQRQRSHHCADLPAWCRHLDGYRGLFAPPLSGGPP